MVGRRGKMCKDLENLRLLSRKCWTLLSQYELWWGVNIVKDCLSSWLSHLPFLHNALKFSVPLIFFNILTLVVKLVLGWWRRDKRTNALCASRSVENAVYTKGILLNYTIFTFTTSFYFTCNFCFTSTSVCENGLWMDFCTEQVQCIYLFLRFFSIIITLFRDLSTNRSTYAFYLFAEIIIIRLLDMQ